MLINNVDISTFKAKQLSADVQSSNITNNSEWIKSSLTPFFEKNTIEFKSIKVSLCFTGSNNDEIRNNITNLLAKCIDSIKLKLDGYVNKFKCILCGSEMSKTVSQEVQVATLSFIGYEYGDDVITTANKTDVKNITVIGSTKAPAIFEITPSINLSDINITCSFANGTTNEIIIKNLTANKKVIVNGEIATITENGINKFSDFESWEFPFLEPGITTITFSRNTCNTNIIYKPRYI